LLQDRVALRGHNLINSVKIKESNKQIRLTHTITDEDDLKYFQGTGCLKE